VKLRCVVGVLSNNTRQDVVHHLFQMKTLLTLLLFALLFAVCWPVALLVLILWPVLWLLSIPFRIVGAALHGLLAFVSALFLLPARLLGYRSRS